MSNNNDNNDNNDNDNDNEARVVTADDWIEEDYKKGRKKTKKAGKGNDINNTKEEEEEEEDSKAKSKKKKKKKTPAAGGGGGGGNLFTLPQKTQQQQAPTQQGTLSNKSDTTPQIGGGGGGTGPFGNIGSSSVEEKKAPATVDEKKVEQNIKDQVDIPEDKENEIKDINEEEEGEDSKSKSKKKKKKKKPAASEEKKTPAAMEEKKTPATVEEKKVEQNIKDQVDIPEDKGNEVKDTNEEEEGEDSKSKSKKKKKKKKPAAEEEKKTPAKKKAPVAAIRAALEAQRAAEEERRRQEEEEQKKIEDERRRIEEEERRKEEDKQKKKEKERAKKEQLKKEGKFLTKAQKAKQQQAQLRLQQMIQSGVIVEGLDKEGDQKPKRVVYAKKKKHIKQEQDKIEDQNSITKAEPEVASRTIEEKDINKSEIKESWEQQEETEKDEIVVKLVDKNIKESWEEEEVETNKAGSVENNNDVKEQWDVSSEEEGEKAPLPQPQELPTEQVKKPSEPAKKVQTKESKKEESEEESEEDSEEESSIEGSEEEESEEESEEEMTEHKKQIMKRKAEAAERRKLRHEEALAARSKDDLRSPICCILGHVDTGKTKLLDKIRKTNVQEGEAGGITQQIGATYFPMETIKVKTAPLNKDGNQEYKLPGLLIIDTPGHESFTNLRSRGSSLCNIAILVVDIMHGLEPQTLESLNLLRNRKTPFIVALNKVDRLFDWKSIPDNSFQDSLSKQAESVKREFQDRVDKTILAFAEQGFNSILYYENKNFAKFVSLIPTSAITGEGIPDMLMLLVNLTQSRMSNQLMYLSELECTVLEVKVVEGLGTTIDVILSNGVLNEGDKIVICGLNGPIVTAIRALLTPQPLRELRVKSEYVHHKSVKAALGIKISAQNLDNAVAGSRLMVVGPDDDEDDLKDEVMSDLKNLMGSIDKTGKGVCVQASTLGSLEALLEFLKVSKIPVSGINIGPVFKKDIMRAAIMLEKAKELACILCFDVKVDKEANDLAEELGIKIFKADIIYHLFDQFTEYNKNIVEQKRKDQAPQAVFPCILKIIPGCVFNKRDPIIVGVDVIEGILRTGTPICVVKTDPETKTRETISLGKVTSIEQNHKSIEVVKKGQAGGGVAVKVECPVYENPKMCGRHFTEADELYSKVSRQSIDILKESFRNDLTQADWQLIIKLKKILDIM